MLQFDQGAGARMARRCAAAGGIDLLNFLHSDTHASQPVKLPDFLRVECAVVGAGVHWLLEGAAESGSRIGQNASAPVKRPAPCPFAPSALDCEC
jgi:hypothetical protein